MEESSADIVVLYKRLSSAVNNYIDTLLPKKNNRPKQTSPSGSWDFGFQTKDDTTYDIQDEVRRNQLFNEINIWLNELEPFFDKPDDIGDIEALRDVLMESTGDSDVPTISIDFWVYLKQIGDIINRKLEEDKIIQEKQQYVIKSQSEQIQNIIYDPNTRLSPIANRKESLADYTSFGIKDNRFKWDEIYDHLVDKKLLEGSREAFIYAMTGEGDTPTKYPCLKWCGSKTGFSLLLRALIGINSKEQFKTAVYIFSSYKDYRMGRDACRIVANEQTREKINGGDLNTMMGAATRLRDSTRVEGVDGDKVAEHLLLNGDKFRLFKELSPAFDSFVNDRPGFFHSKY